MLTAHYDQHPPFLAEHEPCLVAGVVTMGRLFLRRQTQDTQWPSSRAARMRGKVSNAWVLPLTHTCEHHTPPRS